MVQVFPLKFLFCVVAHVDGFANGKPSRSTVSWVTPFGQKKNYAYYQLGTLCCTYLIGFIFFKLHCTVSFDLHGFLSYPQLFVLNLFVFHL